MTGAARPPAAPPQLDVGRPTGRRCSCCGEAPLLANRKGVRLCRRCDLSPVAGPVVWPKWPEDGPT